MDRTVIAERERILHERAEDLARITVDTQAGDHLEVTVFALGAERYAIDSTLVQEIIILNNLMPLPCVPPHIAGIFNLRGKLLAAVDLRTLLGISGDSTQHDVKAVVLTDSGMEFGLVADEIEGVLSLPLADIQDTMITQQTHGARYLRGVTCDRLVLLDGLRLIHDPDLIVNDENS
ncbi:MAG: chemotaxis protein CheW [Desulfuromonadales bacterium]